MLDIPVIFLAFANESPAHGEHLRYLALEANEIRGAFSDLEKNGVQVLFVDVLEQPKYMMGTIGIIPDLVANDHIFKTFSECLEWVQHNVENKH